MEIYNLIKKEFAKIGIDCYLFRVGEDGTYYMKFVEERLWYIRIGNLNEEEKYKWNLIEDIQKDFIEKENGNTRFYFKYNNWRRMVNFITIYYNNLKGIRKNDE